MFKRTPGPVTHHCSHVGFPAKRENCFAKISYFCAIFFLFSQFVRSLKMQKKCCAIIFAFFRIFCFINFHEIFLRKKFAKLERKFLHFFAKRFVCWKSYSQGTKNETFSFFVKLIKSCNISPSNVHFIKPFFVDNK